MKKTLIALSVSAAAMATGVNAAELYNQDGTSLTMGGRAEARFSKQENSPATDKSRVRLNFLGKQAISDELYGVGFWEGEFEANDAADNDTLDNRYVYAGLGGAWGEFTYGKNDGALAVITDFTDIMAYHGNSAAAKLAVADRIDNLWSYKGQFDNLSVKASYRFDDAAGYDNEGYSLSAIYALDNTGVKLGAGFADQGDANELMVAASYNMGDLYFAGTFTTGEDLVGEKKNASSDKDYTGFELAAAYKLGQYVFTSTYNTAEEGDAEVDNFAIDTTYFFKPNFRSYASYNFDLTDEGDNELALGLRYDF